MNKTTIQMMDQLIWKKNMIKKRITLCDDLVTFNKK